jgi:long-chain acyl-CoA synthetase
MALAFWRRALDDPSWTALIEPDGTTWTAGQLLARVNQLTHALQALGLRPGDGIAGLLPNGSAALQVYLAALQGGWYYTPINWHFTAPEVAYIVADSGAKAFFAHERYAAAGAPAAEQAGVPARGRISFGTVAGSTPL